MLKKNSVNIFQAEKLGTLLPVELGDNIPFIAKRVFVVCGVEDNTVRGEHAHKQTQQYLICVQGKVEVVIINEDNQIEDCTLYPGDACFIDKGVWGAQRYWDNAVLIVVASTRYDKEDYLFTRQQWLDWKSETL